jgi:hypothetical protein
MSLSIPSQYWPKSLNPAKSSASSCLRTFISEPAHVRGHGELIARAQRNTRSVGANDGDINMKYFLNGIDDCGEPTLTDDPVDDHLKEIPLHLQ